MFLAEGGRPSDARGFLHKSKFGKFVGGAVKTFVPGVSTAVNVVGTARSFLGGGGGRGGGGRSFGRSAARPVAPRSSTARPSFTSSQEKESGREFKFGGGNGATTLALPFVPDSGRPFNPPQRPPCDFPMVRDSAGRCRKPTSGEFGGEQFGVGEAVMGRYGAALEPGSMIIDRAVCLPGMTLGNDGLCYNKGAITNAQRQWPRGRRPLLTGGDMRAIGIAARAGSKLDRTTKRLRSLGMMKALPKARSARHPALRVPVHKSVDV